MKNSRMKNEEIFLMSIKNKNEDTNLFSNFFFSIEKFILHSSFFILFSFSSSSLPDLKRRDINSIRPRIHQGPITSAHV